MVVSYLILYCIVTLSKGSNIYFLSTPEIISNKLSKTLTLRCSLSDTSAGTPVIQGEKGFIQTSENAKYVTSIVISKFNSEIYVAGINTDNKVSGGHNLNISGLSGDIKKPSGTRIGYLEVEWTKPNSSESGNYNCEITAQYLGGRSVTFKTSINVGINDPTVFDLSARIFEAEKKIVDFMDEDGKLEADNKKEKLDIRSLDNKTLVFERRVSDFESTVKSMFVPHLERGYLEFGDSESWYRSGGNGRKIKYKYVYFSRPYKSLPVVVYAIKQLDSDQAPNLRLNIEVSQVTTVAFKLTCTTWATTRLYNVQVAWFSVDSKVLPI